MGVGEAKNELRAPAERLVRLAREELGEMSARRRAEGLLKLNTRFVPRPRRSRFVLSLAAVAVVGVSMFLGQRWIRDHAAPELSYGVHAGRIDSAGFIQPSGATEPSLRFSDGTQVAFLPGARGRVKSVGEHGARIELSGKIEVAVVPRPGGQWLFDAGPFVIAVTGTAFSAEWRDLEQRLVLVLKTGAVQVSGPVLDGPIALRAGQRLVISAREKEVVISDVERVSAVNAAASARQQSLPGPEPSPSVQPAPRAAPSASNWTAELAAGRFAIILRQAEQRGLDRVLAEGSSDELAALSDAARYSRRDDVARRALGAQRRRFPQSARASDAAFLLGRLEETAKRPELALDWYERYLSEAPRGTYSSEALGLKMTVVQRLHGAARARPIAEDYLRRFQNGTYAAAARALIRAP